MNFSNAFRTVLAVGLAALVAASPALADVVVTKNGTRLVGQVTKI